MLGNANVTRADLMFLVTERDNARAAAERQAATVARLQQELRDQKFANCLQRDLVRRLERELSDVQLERDNANEELLTGTLITTEHERYENADKELRALRRENRQLSEMLLTYRTAQMGGTISLAGLEREAARHPISVDGKAPAVGHAE